MNQQTPIFIDTPKGTRLEIGTGGYLRPVYTLKEFGPHRMLVSDVIGWIDMSQYYDPAAMVRFASTPYDVEVRRAAISPAEANGY